MTVRQRAVTSVGLASSGRGLPPIEEFFGPESWLMALPAETVLRVGLEDGTSFLTSAERLVAGDRLAAVAERIRIQRRLGEL